MERKLDVKSWNEYTKEEKIILMRHWWHYYGKMVFTLAEYEQFNELLESKCDLIYAIAVLGYTNNISSQTLINAMRNDELPQFFNVISNVIESDDENVKTIFGVASASFISEIVTTYNNPQPSVPMSSEELVSQIEMAVAPHNK